MSNSQDKNNNEKKSSCSMIGDVIYEHKNDANNNNQSICIQNKKYLNIIHFNDVYNIEGTRIEPVGGAPRFLTAIDHLKSLSNDNTIVLFSGDAFNPSTLSVILKGKQMVDVLNEMHISAACIGNHDFDFGVDHLVDLINQTNFPWLLSNAQSVITDRPLAEGKIKHIIEVNGIKIGIIALVEEEWIATLCTIDFDDVIFDYFADCGKRLALELKNEDQCDYVIALTHMRMPNDELLAYEVPEIDLILGGHDHDYRVKHANDKFIVKSGSDFRELSLIKICLNSDNLKENFVEKIEKFTVDSSVKENEKLKKVVNSYLDELQNQLDVPLGSINADLDGRFSIIRTQETNLGNFICDIVLETVNADCVIINSGTFRSDSIIPKGEFKVRDLKSILPFLDTVMVIAVTGKQLHLALENGVSQFPKLEGRFPQVSGIQFAFDPSKPPGNRVDPTLVKVQNEYLDFEDTYLLATKVFIREGRDGYDMFKDAQVIVDDEQGPQLITIVENHFKIIDQIKSHHTPAHRPSLVSLARRNKLLNELCNEHLHPSLSTSTSNGHHSRFDSANTSRGPPSPIPRRFSRNRSHSRHNSGHNSPLPSPNRSPVPHTHHHPLHNHHAYQHHHSIAQLINRIVPKYHNSIAINLTHDEIMIIKESEEYKAKIHEYEEKTIRLMPEIEGRIIRITDEKTLKCLTNERQSWLNRRKIVLPTIK